MLSPSKWNPPVSRTSFFFALSVTYLILLVYFATFSPVLFHEQNGAAAAIALFAPLKTEAEAPQFSNGLKNLNVVTAINGSQLAIRREKRNAFDIRKRRRRAAAAHWNWYHTASDFPLLWRQIEERIAYLEQNQMDKNALSNLGLSERHSELAMWHSIVDPSIARSVPALVIGAGVHTGTTSVREGIFKLLSTQNGASDWNEDWKEAQRGELYFWDSCLPLVGAQSDVQRYNNGSSNAGFFSAQLFAHMHNVIAKKSKENLRPQRSGNRHVLSAEKSEEHKAHQLKVFDVNKFKAAVQRVVYASDQKKTNESDSDSSNELVVDATTAEPLSDLTTFLMDESRNALALVRPMTRRSNDGELVFEDESEELRVQTMDEFLEAAGNSGAEDSRQLVFPYQLGDSGKTPIDILKSLSLKTKYLDIPPFMENNAKSKPMPKRRPKPQRIQRPNPERRRKRESFEGGGENAKANARNDNGGVRHLLAEDENVQNEAIKVLKVQRLDFDKKKKNGADDNKKKADDFMRYELKCTLQGYASEFAYMISTREKRLLYFVSRMVPFALAMNVTRLPLNVDEHRFERNSTKAFNFEGRPQLTHFTEVLPPHISNVPIADRTPPILWSPNRFRTFRNAMTSVMQSYRRNGHFVDVGTKELATRKDLDAYLTEVIEAVKNGAYFDRNRTMQWVPSKFAKYHAAAAGIKGKRKIRVFHFEKTPTYLNEAHTALIYARYLPQTKVIHMLRNPFKRMVSFFNRKDSITSVRQLTDYYSRVYANNKLTQVTLARMRQLTPDSSRNELDLGNGILDKQLMGLFTAAYYSRNSAFHFLEHCYYLPVSIWIHYYRQSFGIAEGSDFPLGTVLKFTMAELMFTDTLHWFDALRCWVVFNVETPACWRLLRRQQHSDASNRAPPTRIGDRLSEMELERTLRTLHEHRGEVRSDVHFGMLNEKLKDGMAEDLSMCNARLSHLFRSVESDGIRRRRQRMKEDGAAAYGGEPNSLYSVVFGAQFNESVWKFEPKYWQKPEMQGHGFYRAMKKEHQTKERRKKKDKEKSGEQLAAQKIGRKQKDRNSGF